MNRDEIRKHLTGPISSVRTPFVKDGSVDYKALREIIEFCIQAGSKTVLLTAGDSHYICLSDEEIAQVTKIAVEQTARRAMTVAADRFHSTDRAVKFAQFAQEVGADLQMCMPCDWAQSCTPQTLADHYTEVSKHLPVMIVTNVFLPRGINFALETLKQTLQRDSNVVAVKDDMCGEFARKMALLVHDHWAVISGGQKQNHMNTMPYGCDGYLSTFITFKPEITRKYWKAVETNNLSDARRIIRDYDMPFFDFITSLPGGFDAGMHGAYELFGLGTRWRRKPYYSLNDEEMEKLAEFLRGLSIL